MRRASERIFGVVFERENMLSVSVRKYEERNIMKTTLLIMAAGIGSRFGTGIKQLEPVDASNRIIMDYSIHDAIEAGFNHVVFIIRKDIEKEFKEVIGDRIASISMITKKSMTAWNGMVNDLQTTSGQSSVTFGTRWMLWTHSCRIPG